MKKSIKSLATAIVLGMATLTPAIATAPMAPKLVMAKLNGKPIQVLYVTRSEDKVLVRCYPGYEPKVTVQQKPDGTKEGLLTCQN